MAKADDTSSTIDWIWLRDALELAVAAFGSEALAKKRLMEWLAGREDVPWKGHLGVGRGEYAGVQKAGPTKEGIAMLRCPRIGQCSSSGDPASGE